MALTEKREDKTAILSVDGRLMGGEETKEIVVRIRALVEDGVQNVVLDLSGVPWMNSTGLGALMESRKVLADKSGALKLVAMNEKIKSLLVMTQTLSHYENFASVEEAVQSCA
jgi:anti-sigma B factor antagonist